jgi:hypothetical protein
MRLCLLIGFTGPNSNGEPRCLYAGRDFSAAQSVMNADTVCASFEIIKHANGIRKSNPNHVHALAKREADQQRPIKEAHARDAARAESEKAAELAKLEEARELLQKHGKLNATEPPKEPEPKAPEPAKEPEPKAPKAKAVKPGDGNPERPPE